MKRFLKWLWFSDRDVRVVKAYSLTEMLIDDRNGCRSHVTIVNPGSWLLSRLIGLPYDAFTEEL